jgi:hypothetical protein
MRLGAMIFLFIFKFVSYVILITTMHISIIVSFQPETTKPWEKIKYVNHVQNVYVIIVLMNN